MTEEEKFKDVKRLSSADRRRAHKMLDEVNIPKALTLEKRVEILECRYPASK